MQYYRIFKWHCIVTNTSSFTKLENNNSNTTRVSISWKWAGWAWIQSISRQHLNFQIESLLKRGYWNDQIKIHRGSVTRKIFSKCSLMSKTERKQNLESRMLVGKIAWLGPFQEMLPLVVQRFQRASRVYWVPSKYITHNSRVNHQSKESHVAWITSMPTVANMMDRRLVAVSNFLLLWPPSPHAMPCSVATFQQFWLRCANRPLGRVIVSHAR